MFSLVSLQRSMRVLLPLILCAAGVMAQEKPLPASGEPPDMQHIRRAPKPERAESPSVKQILGRLRLTRAEVERRKNANSLAQLPASPTEPAEISELKRASERPPVLFRSPTIKEILDAIRLQPGGAEKIERARRAGAHIPRDAAMDFQSPSDRSGNTTRYFFTAGETEPPSEVIQDAPTVRVVRGSPTTQSVPGVGELTVFARSPYSINTASKWGLMYRFSATGTNTPVGAAYDVKPYMWVTFYAPDPGYYVINVSAGRDAFEVRHYTAGSYQLLQSFPSPATSGTYSYPILVNLAAGYHYFAWANLNWVWVSEVSATKF